MTRPSNMTGLPAHLYATPAWRLSAARGRRSRRLHHHGPFLHRFNLHLHRLMNRSVSGNQRWVCCQQQLNWQLQRLSKRLLSIEGGTGKLLGALVPITLALVIAGLVLKLAFEGEGLLMSACLVLFMVAIAGHTAGERAKMLPKSRLVATLSIVVGCVGTLLLILSMKVFPMEPRFSIPTAGYVIGNSMSMVGGTLNRLHNGIKLSKGEVEASLALGASPHQAVNHHVQRSVAQGMGPMVDAIKTAGLISLPGSMTGMLMGGSSPLEAVQMQLQVLYMVLGCSAVSCTISSFVGWQMMFTKSQQLSMD